MSSYYPKEVEQKFNEYTKAIKGAFNALSVVERENISEIVKIVPTGLKIALSVVFRLCPASSLLKKRKTPYMAVNTIKNQTLIIYLK